MKYKEGDRVKIKSLDWYNENKTIHGDIWLDNAVFVGGQSLYCGSELTIRLVTKDSYYVVENDYYWTDEMIEELAEDETKFGTALNPIEPKSNANSITQSEIDVIEKAKTYWDSIKDAWICPDGYIFKDENGNVINAQKIVLEKKKKKYPKTFDECCKVLGFLNVDLCFNADYCSFDASKEQWKRLGLMNRFNKLLICRDAYWKIAGEEMGLGKPWKPDWREERYIIYRNKYDIIGGYREAGCVEHHIFEFPIPEMRDAFKKNFDPDIEICKELL